MDLRKEVFQKFLSLELSLTTYMPCSSWMNEGQDFSYLSVLEMDEIIEVGNVRKLNWPSKMESNQGQTEIW
jgi:hypothetical protein